MKNRKIAEAMGVSVRRLRHLGFSLQKFVVMKVYSQDKSCETRILKKERQV